MARLICKRRLMEREHFSAMGSLLCVKEKNSFKYIFPSWESKETELWFRGRVEGKSWKEGVSCQKL